MHPHDKTSTKVLSKRPISIGESVQVTAIVLTYNEEANIEKCLRSIVGFCSQIIVVDSGSTDATADICRRFTNEIILHPFTDHATQWHWALNHSPIVNAWVMPLDADHEVTESLKRELRRVWANPARAD
jgi:glycosyltransferase involved in cell wall biosynthesis